MEAPKEIKIFLPDGNPGGLKVVELSNRNIRALQIPRSALAEVKRAELSQPALYLLCDREGENAYIGECENFLNRVKDHDQKKDFWEIALVFTADGIEKSDVKYLESLAVQEAKAAERMEILNSTSPVKNKLHEFKAATINEFFSDIKMLASVLGYPVFDRVKALTALLIVI